MLSEKDLQRFDENADELYPKLLDAANVTVDRESGTIIRDKQGSFLVGLGIPDLLFRLKHQQAREQKAGKGLDAIARAKIWRHVAESCKPGDTIADITDDSQLNAWLPSSHPKFARVPILRNCESCGLKWYACEKHFALVAAVEGTRPQQSDARKPWLCHWCCQHSAVRHRYGMETKPIEKPKRKKRSPNRNYLARVAPQTAVSA